MHRPRSAWTVIVTALGAGLLTPVLPAASASESCVSGHGRVHLTGFAGPTLSASLFYAVGEGGEAGVTIQPSPGDCTPNGAIARATYRTENALATEPQDYTQRSGTTAELCWDQHPEFCPAGMPAQEVVNVPTVDDGALEAAVEPFLFRVTDGTLGLTDPTVAPVHVIDNNGTPRAALEPHLSGGGAVSYLRSETFSLIKIPVFLAGPVTSGSVGYTVEPDPAAPATAGADFDVLSPNPLTFPGSRVSFIDLAIVNDKFGEGPESVTITLNATGSVAPASPSSTTFTIMDNEESEPPTTRIHHPRHGWQYKKSDYRIREVHIFASDNPGGAGVVGVELALRRNLKNGDCVWLTKDGWQKRDCSNRQWLDTTFEPAGELWLVPLKQLKSSVGTSIETYTAFSRGIDRAGNAERVFNEKRNGNTFEVKRRKSPR